MRVMVRMPKRTQKTKSPPVSMLLPKKVLGSASSQMFLIFVKGQRSKVTERGHVWKRAITQVESRVCVAYFKACFALRELSLSGGKSTNCVCFFIFDNEEYDISSVCGMFCVLWIRFGMTSGDTRLGWFDNIQQRNIEVVYVKHFSVSASGSLFKHSDGRKTILFLSILL